MWPPPAAAACICRRGLPPTNHQPNNELYECHYCTNFFYDVCLPPDVMPASSFSNMLLYPS
uniref:Uncharacterized protein n=1 Tax=Oryza meridionalis TaxID=40149 RepID=A0A0E0DEJ6_9ORYZ